jgi:murein DD-endopeptidase MepM/ murein hydrolase activator NlpD
MATSIFPLLFLQASISALVTASLAWTLLALARRRWPGLDARRAPWLLAQLAGAVTLAVTVLPAASQLSMFAAAPSPGAAQWAVQVPDAIMTVVLQESAAEFAALDLLPALAWLWLCAYAAGAARHGLRWRRVGRELRALLFVADRLDAASLRSHPAFASHRAALPPVLEIDAPISPMLAGLVHPVLLLPRHMRGLPPAQQQLIVAHELMHLRRRDHLWQHAATLLQLLLWFVPAVHSLHGRLQWALELGCDRAVLAGRPQDERRSYAAALLAQLAMQARAGSARTTAPASLAFGAHGAQAVADRIRLIRDAHPGARLPLAGSAALLLLPALCGASVLLQPQFAWRDGADAAASPGAAPAAPAWQAPLANLRVTSSFGSINRPGGTPHQGMDFGAARGTAVLAPADGKVAVSTDRYEGGARYGKVVVIEHASGTRTLYAHLDTRLVRAGERVQAGQRIALSGATGKVTGPHLHFEVSRQGAAVDPQVLLKGAR